MNTYIHDALERGLEVSDASNSIVLSHERIRAIIQAFRAAERAAAVWISVGLGDKATRA